MNNMPKALRKELAADPYYAVCCITGEPGKRGNPIEWHHNLIYAGRQVQEKFAILPVKRTIHAKASKQEIKHKLDWVMLNRATDQQLLTISKAKDYFLYKHYLNKKFGVYPHQLKEIQKPGIRYPWLNEAEENEGVDSMGITSEA